MHSLTPFNAKVEVNPFTDFLKKNPNFDPLDCWRYSSVFTIANASLLAYGYDPSKFEKVLDMKIDEMPFGFYATYTSLCSEIEAKMVDAIPAFCQSNYRDYDEIDFSKTTIKKEVLRNYFREAYRDTKVIGAFFFNNAIIEGERPLPYHNEKHPLYSKRLNACVEAWNAIHENPELLLDKTPRQAIDKYLTDNAIELGFSEKFLDNDKSELERITIVASWLTGSESKKYKKNCVSEIKENIESLYPKLKAWDYDLIDLNTDNTDNNNKTIPYDLDDDIPF